VINNFVSGLILLFERPIKVGDVIEVGGNVGEVTRIGIRASVIRTADGSEVIVPNGSLISSQVTNWTFSDRQRAVEVSVNVAGGSDPQRVVELLKSTAAAHPGVTKAPAPQVYVTNFSAGAVTFQLRAWTDCHEEEDVAKLLLLFSNHSQPCAGYHRLDACSKTGLHPPFVRELFSMRKRIGMTARLIVLALMASLASCQSGQSGGNATSKADITDPNTAFSQGGAQTSTANGTTSGVSSRRGGLLPGSDADSQGR
jgi:hypothetical protein